VTRRPTRATTGGQAYLDLRKAASAAGRPTDELLQLYALEGLLDRLSGSPHADRFVLKGGVLLAAFDARRPTRDVDLAAIDLANDIDDIRVLVNDVLAIARDDGLEFDLDATSAAAIRDDDLYGGVRVTVRGVLSTAAIRFHVDVNLGDPLWPPPAEVVVPRLLGGQPIRIRGYRVELVLAEKIVTAIQRGAANTRWRDFVDIANLAHRDVDDRALVESIRRVAEFRRAPIQPLNEVLARYPEIAQQRWAAWRRKQGLAATTPARFADLVDNVVAFADPLLQRAATSE
jgi:predicted nucleotidyltransferase component of viral defense system